MNLLDHVEAVTFDVGGTLIRPWPSVGHVYAEVAAGCGCEEVSPEVLNLQFAAAWANLKNFNHGRGEWATLVDTTFEGLTKQLPSETFFPELYDRFASPDVWRVYDDVAHAVDMLASRGIQLGIVSNWDDRLRAILEGLGLSKYFEAIIVSCEVGFPKPSPVIFEHASKKLGMAPEFILHVGDSMDQDVAGAKSAGFQSVLLERRAQEPKRDGQIKSLVQLDA
jgi:putative hydrolase of the HAD superfamily